MRALRAADGAKFALMEGGRAMTWGSQGATIPLHEVSDIGDAATASSASCVQNLAGEVRCHFTGMNARDEEMADVRGATALRLGSTMLALMPDGTLVMHAVEGAPRMESATNIGLLAIEGYGAPTAITRDGRVLEWSTPATPEGVLVATEITLPALGATPAATPLPEGRIPRWCTIEAEWIAPSEPSPLDALRDAILGPPGYREVRNAASLCESVRVAYDSPDCPASGPWLAQHRQTGELVLVVSRPLGLAAEIPDLAALSEGTEEDESITRWQLRAAHPLDAVLSISRSEQSCFNEEDCGLDEVEIVHTALRENEGRLLRVTAHVDRHRAFPDVAAMSQELTLEVSGNTMNLWVCGGHTTRRLPALPADASAAVEAPITPATEAEAQAASAQCADGWRAFGVGDFDGARTTLDAALAVLERAQDPSGIRARGACLYNRGRVAEQDQDIPAARGFYERSIAARPNDVVTQRLAALP